MRLHLCTSLYYTKTEALPSEIRENEEFIQFYELDPVQSLEFEPDPQLLSGSLVFIGHKPCDLRGDSDVNLPEASPQVHLATKLPVQARTVSLPAGEYLFVQIRGPLMSKSEWLDVAIEQQKDGLWERYKLKAQLYIRYLFEDGQFVTQVLRPIL